MSSVTEDYICFNNPVLPLFSLALSLYLCLLGGVISCSLSVVLLVKCTVMDDFLRLEQMGGVNTNSLPEY